MPPISRTKKPSSVLRRFVLIRRSIIRRSIMRRSILIILTIPAAFISITYTPLPPAIYIFASPVFFFPLIFQSLISRIRRKRRNKDSTLFQAAHAAAACKASARFRQFLHRNSFIEAIKKAAMSNNLRLILLAFLLLPPLPAPYPILLKSVHIRSFSWFLPIWFNTSITLC